MRGLASILLAGLFVCTFSLTAHAGKDNGIDYKQPVSGNEIKVMAYNVENLFDVEHDAGKNDIEFLPKDSPYKKDCYKEGAYEKQCLKTDWTSERLAVKLSQIKRVLDSQGPLPDILVLEEIENVGVVGQLARVLGYRSYQVSDSPDARGIDVAVLYNEGKLEYLGRDEMTLSDSGLKTRNLLAVNFRLHRRFSSNEIIGVFANHWPSQGKPTPARLTAARDLKAFIAKQAAVYGKNVYNAIAMGDFNTLKTESPNPLNDVMLTGTDGLVDVFALAKAKGNPLIPKMPPGTYYFFKDKQWNELDHIMVSRLSADGRGVEVDPMSFRILATAFMTDKYGFPERYDHNSGTADKAGFSDHFPLAVKLRLR